MEIQFLGHAAISLTSKKGEKLLIDPYRSGALDGKIQYTPIQGDWDWVMITHQHEDHNAKSTLSRGFKYKEAELKKKFKLQRHAIAHDEYDGDKFGGEVDILEFEIDKFRVLHLSDLGRAPDAKFIRKLKEIDICFLPVGGFYTIGSLQAKAWWNALRPTVTIPIHYKTPSVDLDLEEVEHFLSLFPSEMIQKKSHLSFEKREDLANLAEIIELEVQNQKDLLI